jgi:hypothetical protein
MECMLLLFGHNKGCLHTKYFLRVGVTVRNEVWELTDCIPRLEMYSHLFKS